MNELSAMFQISPLDFLKMKPGVFIETRSDMIGFHNKRVRAANEAREKAQAKQKSRSKGRR